MIYFFKRTEYYYRRKSLVISFNEEICIIQIIYNTNIIININIVQKILIL
jgi:hypothetical protein